MNRWPRRSFIVAIIALVLWVVSMACTFLADGGWRFVGLVVWLSSMIVFFVLLWREQFRQTKPKPPTG
jgi:hypothetical protein